MMRKVAILAVLAQIAAAQLDTSACGRSKGCLFAPQGCNNQPAGCQLTMSYVVDGSDMVFELQGKPPGNGYMAIGFSKDMQMGDDSVSACASNQQILAYNEGKSVLPVNGTKHMLEGLTATNGESYCRIRRAISGNGSPRIFDLDQPYVIFLAYGPMNGNGIGYHQMNKWIMPRQALSSYSTTGGFNPSTVPEGSEGDGEDTMMMGGTMNGTMAPTMGTGTTTMEPTTGTTTGRNGASDLVSLMGCAALSLALFSFTRY